MRSFGIGLVLIASLSTAVIGCGGSGGVAAASGTPMPSAGVVQSGKVVTVVQNGADHSDLYQPKGSTVKDVGDSVELVSTRDALYDASVEYTFDPTQLPAGSTIARMDVAICGTASGDFWEFYGPDATPYEQEVTPPEADGCWHFVEADGSYQILAAYVYRNTNLRIDRVVWTITLS